MVVGADEHLLLRTEPRLIAGAADGRQIDALGLRGRRQNERERAQQQ